MATWKTKISYGDTVLYDGITNEVAFEKILNTNNKLLNGNIKVKYYKYGRLPEGYTEVQYIQSNGTNVSDTGPVIDTGVKPAYNQNIKVKCNWPSMVSSAYGVVVGAATYDNTRPSATVIGHNSSWNWNFEWAQSSNTGSGVSTNTDYEVEIILNSGSQTVKVNGSTMISLSSSDSTCQSTYYLFGKHNGDSNLWKNPCTVKIYYVTIINNGTTVRNMIPCKNSSNVAGFYDLINNTFYQNIGTSSLTAGPEV